MKRSEALYVVSILQTAFPSRMLPDDTVKLYASELLDYEVEDAAAAVHAGVRVWRFLPSLSELLSEVQAARRQRLLEADVPELPSHGDITFAEYLDAHPEMRERVKRVRLEEQLAEAERIATERGEEVG